MSTTPVEFDRSAHPFSVPDNELDIALDALVRYLGLELWREEDDEGNVRYVVRREDES